MSECPACSSPLVVISLKIATSDVLMRSCSRCDRRFWQSDGEDIDLTGMLGREPVRQPALR